MYGHPLLYKERETHISLNIQEEGLMGYVNCAGKKLLLIDLMVNRI